MATTAAANTRARRPHVTPSLVKSETFLFALLVVGLAIYVPYMFKTGRGSTEVRYVNTTTPVYSVPDAVGVPPPPVVVTPPPAPVVAAPPVTPPAPVQVAAPPGEQRPPPITYILPYIVSLIRSILSFIARLPVFIYRIIYTAIFVPLSYPLALILAILRPITLLLQVIYAVFLRTPIAIMSWFIREAIYPLYVFTGIAAILGVTFGYSASHVPRAAIYVTERIRSQFAIAPGGQPALLASAGTGVSRRRAALGGRTVSFGGVDDGEESDATEVDFRYREPAGLGLRGVPFGGDI